MEIVSHIENWGFLDAVYDSLFNERSYGESDFRISEKYVTREKVNKTIKDIIDLLKMDGGYLISETRLQEYGYLNFSGVCFIDETGNIDKRRKFHHLDANSYDFISAFVDVVELTEYRCVSKLKPEMMDVESSEFWLHRGDVVRKEYERIARTKQV